MALTSQAVLRSFILLALHDLGGSATKPRVLEAMEDRLSDVLTDDDRRRQPSNGEVKWENQTAWERNAMVGDGLIAPYVAGRTTRGVWTLTARGKAEAARVRG